MLRLEGAKTAVSVAKKSIGHRSTVRRCSSAKSWKEELNTAPAFFRGEVRQTITAGGISE